jgi:hypothetical protein
VSTDEITKIKTFSQEVRVSGFTGAGAAGPGPVLLKKGAPLWADTSMIRTEPSRSRDSARYVCAHLRDFFSITLLSSSGTLGGREVHHMVDFL